MRIGIAILAIVIPLAAQPVSILHDGSGYKVPSRNAGTTEPASGWSSIFAVYAGEGDVPPMLGAYSVEQGWLVFHPKYAPSPGVGIRAVFRAPGAAPVEARFNEAKVDLQPSAYVEQVYPTADLLPDNLLKFYIEFSAPMSRGEAWTRIHLVDASGTPIKLPFLEIVQELWDRDNRRLTVLFDPGRIKRGLLRREQMGPALVEGKGFSLVIDREFQDARGVPMRAEFLKQFRVAPSDRMPPQVAQWKLSAPGANTAEALSVGFPKPMDWAMLQRALQVRGASGSIAGTATIGRDETEWRFVPDQPWKPGEYELIVDNSFEDWAGNRIDRPFDVDVDKFDKITEHVEVKSTSLRFQVAGK